MDAVPIREVTTSHQCRCLLIFSAGPRRRQATSPCHSKVDSPDAPFCRSCDDRHPNLSKDPLIEVTAL